MSFPEPNIIVDVIVVGYGAAGATAALTAHEHGAQTLILEKMPRGGGNSYVSSANMVFPKNTADADKFADYLNEVNFGTTERELVDTFVQGLLENPAWLESLGGELEIYDGFKQDPSLSYYIPNLTFPGLPSAQGLEVVALHLKQTETCPEPTGGHRLWKLLDRHVKSRRIKVMVSTPTKELVKNSRGEIIGVIAETEGQEIFICAKKGVIMTCGGFENNQKMKSENLDPKKDIGLLGSPGNTGDGIKMVQKVGAQLWHMNAQATVLGFKPAEFETGFAITLRKPGFIYVDRYGNRFLDETRLEAHEAGVATSEFDTRTYTYSRLPCYVIMDEENARGKSLCLSIFSNNVVALDYKWSEDNSKEIEKGWILKADNLNELSKLLQLDETALQLSIGKYNHFCCSGVDSDFGRKPETLKPIKPPYYAMQLMPLLYNTQGGPRRDKQARVLDPDGNPIPRLYAAGEFGSIWGFRYQTSTNVSECLVYGRIAGKNAAKS
ncbi:FAD-binding protein [Scytonema sp. PCC 10023]|uniref:FAD-dependent oxidoreductase n=1 Tax=Scytonema sp. PCC 10023 TaxID=1680591 RepID=UPI0039C653EC